MDRVRTNGIDREMKTRARKMTIRKQKAREQERWLLSWFVANLCFLSQCSS